MTTATPFRNSPSGPRFEGSGLGALAFYEPVERKWLTTQNVPANGQSPVWDSVAEDWLFAAAGGGGQPGFDFVIEDLSDIAAIAPVVGGEYIMPEGSYSILGSITLDNPLQFDGVDALIQFMGDGQFIGTVATVDTIRKSNGARLILINPQVVGSSAGNAILLESADVELKSIGGTIEAGYAGVYAPYGGSTQIMGLTLNQAAGSYGLAVFGGSHQWDNIEADGGFMNFFVNGPDLEVQASNLRSNLTEAGHRAFRILSGGNVQLDNLKVDTTQSGAAYGILGTVNAAAKWLFSNIHIASSGALTIGAAFDNTSARILARNVVTEGCGIGIFSNPQSINVDGLDMDAGTPLSGADAEDPRCTARALTVGGLRQVETPITNDLFEWLVTYRAWPVYVSSGSPLTLTGIGNRFSNGESAPTSEGHYYQIPAAGASASFGPFLVPQWAVSCDIILDWAATTTGATGNFEAVGFNDEAESWGAAQSVSVASLTPSPTRKTSTLFSGVTIAALGWAAGARSFLELGRTAGTDAIEMYRLAVRFYPS